MRYTLFKVGDAGKETEGFIMYASKETKSSKAEYFKNTPRKASSSSLPVMPIQRYIYPAHAGHARAGYENHHIMPSSVLENQIPAYCVRRGRNQRRLTQHLGDEFDWDIETLTQAQHSRPHPRYNAFAQGVLNVEGGFDAMVDEILNGQGDIEDRVMTRLRTRVRADKAANRSIDY